MYVRAQVFVSRALFPTPVCVLKIGDPVIGFCDPKNGVANSAQLVSWPPTAVDNVYFSIFVILIGDLDTWIRSSPTTYPTHFEMHQGAIYPFPQLRAANFDYLRAPRLNAGVCESPRLSSVLTPPLESSTPVSAPAGRTVRSFRSPYGRCSDFTGAHRPRPFPFAWLLSCSYPRRRPIDE